MLAGNIELTVLDLCLLGRRAATWIDNNSSRSCSDGDLALILAGSFLAKELSGETLQAGWTAEHLSTVASLPPETTAVLARLGLARSTPQANAGSVPSAYDMLTAGPDETQSLVGAVEQASGFGRYRLTEKLGLADALSGVGLGYLASYDLELGCRLLRAANYAGADNCLVQRWGIEFLARHQQPNGAFGFIAMDLSDDIDPLDTRLIYAYYLPITVACLWTIAELSIPGFYLLDIPNI